MKGIVQGFVYDNGIPVAGVEVRILNSSRGSRLEAVVLTDSNGEFSSIVESMSHRYITATAIALSCGNVVQFTNNWPEFPDAITEQNV